MTLELNRIYNMDCLEGMRQMPDKSVDLVLTDPPYSEKTHVGMRSLGKNHHAISTIDFDSINSDQLEIIFDELGRITKGWVISFIDWRHAAKLEENPPKNLNFIRMGIWVKPNGMPQLTGDRPSTGWEAIVFLHRNDVIKKWNGGGSSSVFIYNNVRAGRFVANFHPAEKPLPLLQELLDLFSEPDDIIIDPFMGSGSTGVISALIGRNFIGYEKDPKYFRVAEDRIKKAREQGKLGAWF